MKTAISIPDPLFAKGEKLARKLKIKRSQLYARALAEMIRHHDDGEITRRLNEIYGPGGVDSTLDPALERAALEVFRRSEWK